MSAHTPTRRTLMHMVTHGGDGPVELMPEYTPIDRMLIALREAEAYFEARKVSPTARHTVQEAIKLAEDLCSEHVK